MTLTTPEIRLAGPADIPAIIALAEATWEPTYRPILAQHQICYMFGKIYTPEALTLQMEQLGHQFLLLQQADRALGFASVGPFPARPAEMKLHKLYLLPECQGTGLGRQLLHAVEHFARGKGATALRLNVNRHNPAQHFYARCGYQIIAEEDIPIGPYEMNDYVMRKVLA